MCFFFDIFWSLSVGFALSCGPCLGLFSLLFYPVVLVLVTFPLISSFPEVLVHFLFPGFHPLSWSAAYFSSRTFYSSTLLLFGDSTLEVKPSPTQRFLFLVDDDNLISFQNCFGFIAWIQSNCRFVNLTSCTAAKFIASSSECSQSIRGRIKPWRFIK